jgi:hypothetical protein
MSSGGKADVSLDGGPPETIDVYEPGHRGNESLFHRFNLPAGRHTVKLVVRGEPYEGSAEQKKGADVAIRDLVVFR